MTLRLLYDSNKMILQPKEQRMLVRKKKRSKKDSKDLLKRKNKRDS